ERDRHADRRPAALEGATRDARRGGRAAIGGGRGGGVSGMSTATLDRTLVERLVREALHGRANAKPSTNGKPKLVVNVSARHCHVTQEDLERLFGKGRKLTP